MMGVSTHPTSNDHAVHCHSFYIYTCSLMWSVNNSVLKLSSVVN